MTQVTEADRCERWPGYNEQSWPQRFAELDRQLKECRTTLLEIFSGRAEAREAVAERDARIAELEAKLAFVTAYPLGTHVRKISGPEWRGIVVGHYSSTFTPEGLVIECTADGARGQVHVEPAKRMENDNVG